MFHSQEPLNVGFQVYTLNNIWYHSNLTTNVLYLKDTENNYYRIDRIKSKIKRDTVLRSETGKLYKDGDFYYYEDDILGIPDFRRWMRIYGSSITVLEPQTLIKEIIENITKTLTYYEKLNAIKA